jgi:hypothetical protein
MAAGDREGAIETFFEAPSTAGRDIQRQRGGAGVALSPRHYGVRLAIDQVYGQKALAVPVHVPTLRFTAVSPRGSSRVCQTARPRQQQSHPAAEADTSRCHGAGYQRDQALPQEAVLWVFRPARNASHNSRPGLQLHLLPHSRLDWPS